jgi:hypothetical protein
MKIIVMCLVPQDHVELAFLHIRPKGGNDILYTRGSMVVQSYYYWNSARNAELLLNTCCVESVFNFVFKFSYLIVLMEHVDEGM